MATLGLHCCLCYPLCELKFVLRRDSSACSSSCCSSSAVRTSRCSSPRCSSPACVGGTGPLASHRDSRVHRQAAFLYFRGLNRSLGKDSSFSAGLERRGKRYTFGNGKSSMWARSRSRRCRTLQVAAKADDSMSSSEMSLESALKLLGVGEGASFNEILTAKKTLVDSSDGDQDRIAQVEAAYDTLLMQSLSQRRQGKVLDKTIRYADVRKPKLRSTALSGGPEWLRVALQRSPVAIEAPSPNAVGIQSGVYGALIIWTFATGIVSSGPIASAAGPDVPGFILAIGFGASLYFLRKQNLKLGKATLVTVAGLVVGAVIGGTVESWLRVDIVPLFGIGSPAVVVSEFVLLSLYFTSLFLR